MGQMLASGRTIEVDFTILDPSMLTAMRAAPIPDENPVEEDLVIWVAYDQPLIVQARCARWVMPTDAQWAAGYKRGTFQFKCTDPRKYALTLRTASTPPPSASGSGLAFPLKFPMDFGPSSSGGVVSVVNNGNAATWPIFLVDGPSNGPIITSLDDGKQLVFSGYYSVQLGQQLLINTDTREVSVAGVTQRPGLMRPDWFSFPPGVAKRISFSSYDPGYSGPTTRLTVLWRDAYL